jgi:hypothetical protein
MSEYEEEDVEGRAGVQLVTVVICPPFLNGNMVVGGEDLNSPLLGWQRLSHEQVTRDPDTATSSRFCSHAWNTTRS